MRVRLKNIGDKKLYSVYGFHNPGESWTIKWNKQLNRVFLSGDLYKVGVIVTEIISNNDMGGGGMLDTRDPRILSRISDSSRILGEILNEDHSNQPEEFLLDKLSRVEQFMRESQEIICSGKKKRKHISPLGATVEDGE